MSTRTKPIPIPRDLQEGDEILLSDGDIADIKNAYDRATPYWEDGIIKAVPRKNPARDIFRPNGYNYASTECPFAVRIIRKARKPAKVKKDRDAEWLREISKIPFLHLSKRRLHRIAKRLESEP